MACPDFLPVTVIVISRHRERRSLRDSFRVAIRTPEPDLQAHYRPPSFFLTDRPTSAVLRGIGRLVPGSLTLRFPVRADPRAKVRRSLLRCFLRDDVASLSLGWERSTAFAREARREQ